MRSGCKYGKGFNSTESTTVKMAVLAPMPKASAAMAMAVNPGFLRSMRTA